MNAVAQLLAHTPFDQAAHLQRLWMFSAGLGVMVAGLIVALHAGRTPADDEAAKGDVTTPDDHGPSS